MVYDGRGEGDVRREKMKQTSRDAALVHVRVWRSFQICLRHVSGTIVK